MIELDQRILTMLQHGERDTFSIWHELSDTSHGAMWVALGRLEASGRIAYRDEAGGGREGRTRRLYRLVALRVGENQ